MLSKYRSLALCAFFVVPALLLSACGSDVPGNSVAKIGDQSIKKTTFDHWMQIAAVSQAGQTNPNSSTAPKVTIPDPPDFTKCVAGKKASAAAPAKGQPEPTEAQLKGQCRQEYNALRDQVLPPTINLEDPDPACDLDYVPLKSREARLDVAVSNSMGLGGHNGAVVLRRASF